MPNEANEAAPASQLELQLQTQLVTSTFSFRHVILHLCFMSFHYQTDPIRYRPRLLINHQGIKRKKESRTKMEAEKPSEMSFFQIQGQ